METHSTKIWLHTIWQTGNRLPLILPEMEEQVYKTIVAEFSNSNCKVEAINGIADHVHILFLLNAAISIDQLIQLTQNDSSKLINTECFKASSFHWQANPLVLSVSESQIPKLAEYIKNQKSIHQTKTLQAEYSEFKKLHALN